MTGRTYEDGIAEGVARCADWLKSPAGTDAFAELIAAELAKAVAAERDRIASRIERLPEPVGGKAFEDGWQAALANVAALLRGDQP